MGCAWISLCLTPHGHSCSGNYLNGGKDNMNRIALVTLLAAFVFCFAAFTAPADAARKIIYSTDIGDDIDDAFGLVFILNSPELDLDSVIVSFGPTQRRGKLAAKLLEIAGRQDIPMIVGRHTKDHIRENERRQLTWSDDYVYTKPPVTDSAHALARRIMRSPDKITLVPVGPLTDIADLLRIAPEVRDKIDEIILMGGSAYYGYNMRKGPTAEHNIKCDIKSAQEVFASGVPIVMVGLDVTGMMQPSKEDMKRIAESEKPLVQALHTLFKAWGHSVPTMYDSVAIAVSFQRDLVKMEHLCIEVDDHGFTRIIPNGKPNVYACTDIDKDGFMSLFISRILR